MSNINLHTAKSTKNDEFYTQLEDINAEMIHYETHFKGKVVLMNCDDPTWSNFWRYFHMEFERLGLKKIISTHYETSETPSYMMTYEGGNDENFEIGIRTELKQNGDFRSHECLELLKEADIVVTNPPFSLFREYVSLLVKYSKEFLIIGNMNAIKYKEIFPLLKDNVLWLGNSSPKKFIQPNGEIKKFGNIIWYTNLDHNKRHELLETTYKFAKRDELYPELYPVFDELHNVININKIAEIPMDYKGIMAVPITFLTKYNPDQFEILDVLNRYTVLDYFGVNSNVQLKHSHCCNINGKPVFSRIAIRRKTVNNKE